MEIDSFFDVTLLYCLSFWLFSIAYWFNPKVEKKQKIRKIILGILGVVVIISFICSVISIYNIGYSNSIYRNSVNNLIETFLTISLLFMFFDNIPFVVDIIVFNIRRVNDYNKDKKEKDKLSNTPSKVLSIIAIIIAIAELICFRVLNISYWVIVIYWVLLIESCLIINAIINVIRIKLKKCKLIVRINNS